MERELEVLAEKHASRRADLSASALRKWHDRLHGPRDSSGRRIYTVDFVEEICAARESTHSTRR
jgi:hypothetical protein